MRKYLKATRRLCLKWFRSDLSDDVEKELEAAEDYNNCILSDILGGLLIGVYSYAKVKEDRRLYVFTKSLRGEFVQLTFMHISGNGEIVPDSHWDIRSIENLHDIYLGGKYITIAETA